MLRPLRGTIAVLVWFAASGIASAQEVQTPQGAIPGQYIVVLNDQQVARDDVRGLATAAMRQYGGSIVHVYERALRGYTARMSATAAAALARNPRVRYVEQDSVREIVATQTGATWGLDRIDQRDRPLDGNYTYESAAQGVHVYIIDTGVRPTHTEFGGRVSATGHTSITDGNGTNDCFLAFAWDGVGAERLLVVVNYAPNRSQCYVRPPVPDMTGRRWMLADLLGDAAYERDGDDLQARGLYLDLGPWQYHVFDVKPAAP